MAGLILVGVLFIGIGCVARLLRRSQRWVSSVVTSQNRLPWVMRGRRRATTDLDVQRGIATASYFAICIGALVLGWAIYVAIR